MTSASNTGLSNAGITKLANGSSIIPASTRADGSVRKEIRVKPGYKPPEDVAVYKNRTAEAWHNRGKGGVLGAEPVQSDDKQQPLLTASAQKNAKRKEARKRAAATVGDDTSKSASQDMPDEKAPIEVKEPDKGKEARKLAKKLRQAKELQDKKEQGDSLLPEQLAKVIKISELIRQLDALGFDHDGEERDKNDQPD